MAIGVVAIIVGVALVCAAPWFASEGRSSKLSEVFLLRLLWNVSTSGWWVRLLGACFVVFGAWMVAVD